MGQIGGIYFQEDDDKEKEQSTTGSSSGSGQIGSVYYSDTYKGNSPSQVASQENKTFKDITPDEVKDETKKSNIFQKISSSISNVLNKISQASYTPAQNISDVDITASKKRIESTTKDITMDDALDMKINDPISYYLNKPFYSSDEKLVVQDRDIPADVAVQKQMETFSNYYNSLDEVGKASLMNPIRDMTDDTYSYYKIGAENILNKTNEDIQYLESRLSSGEADKDEKKRLDVLYEQQKNLEFIRDGVVNNEGVFRGVLDGIQENGYVPYVGNLIKGTYDAKDAYDILSGVRKMQNGEELTVREQTLIEEVKKNSDIESLTVNRGLGYEIGKGITDSAYLMVDYLVSELLTPFIPDEVAVTAGRASRVASKALSWGIKAGKVTLTSGLPRIAEDIATYQTPEYQFDWNENDFEVMGDGDKAGKAIIKAIGKEYGNNIIEVGLGDGIEMTDEFVKKGMSELIGKEIGATTKNEVIKALVKKGGWNGFAGEFAEEIAQKYFEEGVIDGKPASDIKFTVDEIATITASILLMEGAISTAEGFGVDDPNIENVQASAEQKIIDTVQSANDRASGDISQEGITTKIQDTINGFDSAESFIDAFEQEKEIVSTVFDPQYGAMEETPLYDDVLEYLQQDKFQKMYEDGATDQEVLQIVYNELQSTQEKNTELEGKINDAIESKLAVEDLTAKELNNLGSMFIELQESVSSPQKTVNMTTNDITGESTFSTSGTGYPSWMPTEYRSKKIVNEVLDAIINSEIPKSGTKAHNLYSLLLQNSRESEDFLGYTTARRQDVRRYDDIQSMDDIRRNLDILRKDAQKGKEVSKKETETYDADILTDYASNSLAKSGEGLDKANNLKGAKVSYKEAETGLANNGKYLKDRIVFGKNEAGDVIIKDGRHLLEAYRQLDKTIPSDKVKFEDGVKAVEVSDSGYLAQKKTSKTSVKKEVKSYDLNDNYEATVLERMFDEKTINNWKQGVFEWGRYKTKAEIEERMGFKIKEFKKETGVKQQKAEARMEEIREELKGKESEFSKELFDKEVAKYGSLEEAQDFIFYHGTDNVISGGLKPSIALNEDVPRGGGYGQDYYAISLSSDPKIASIFSKNGIVYETILKKGSKIIERIDLEDSIELEEELIDLLDQGVDAVKLGDWSNEEYGEREIAVINPESLIVGDTVVVPDKAKAKAGESIEEYEKRVSDNKSEAFAMGDKVKELVKKYGRLVGEKYLPKGTLGVFYTKTGNITLNSVTDFNVATHEIAHAIDKKNKISEMISENDTGILVSELSQVYIDHYPTAKKTDEKRTKVVEGFATFIQNYLVSPSQTTQEYPHLVKEIINDGGKYNNKMLNEFMKDTENIISQYQGLDAIDRVGTLISKSSDKSIGKAFLNTVENFQRKFVDALLIPEKMGKEIGVKDTNKDFTAQMRFISTADSIVTTNITTLGNKLSKKDLDLDGSRADKIAVKASLFNKTIADTYWSYDVENHKMVSKYDYNWGTLINQLSGGDNISKFNNVLVARRANEGYRQYNELIETKKQLEEDGVAIDEQILKLQTSSLLKGKDDAVLDQIASLQSELKLKQALIIETEERIKDLKKILERDGIQEQLAKEATEGGDTLFSEELKMYDKLVAEDLLLLKNVGILDNAKYQELKENKGYAPFKRIVYDEIINEPDPAILGYAPQQETSIGSLKKRKGSKKEIIPPLDSSIYNHREIVNKALRQDALNMYFNQEVMEMFPDLHQQVDYVEGIEKDKNVYITTIGGDKRAYKVDKSIRETLEDAFNRYADMDQLSKVMRKMRRIFSRGTTQLSIQFATGNITSDMDTYSSISKQDKDPFFSAVSDMYKLVSDRSKSSKETEYMTEFYAINGQNMLLQDFAQQGSEEFVKNMYKETKGIRKAMKLLEKGVDIFSISSDVSETVFRLTEYIEARKAGKSQPVALERARVVTGAFHHRGSWRFGKDGKRLYWDTGIDFFNAGVESVASVYNAVMDTMNIDYDTYNKMTPKERVKFWNYVQINKPKLFQRFMWTMTRIVAMQVAGMAMTWTLGDDDDKDQLKDLYAEDWTKYTYILNPLAKIFPERYKGQSLIRIKTSETLGWVGGTINMFIMDNVLAKDDVDYKFNEYVTALTGFLPDQYNIPETVANLASGDGLVEMIGKQLSSWLPTAFQPLMSMLGLKTYPEVMPLESTWMKSKLPSSRFNEGTSTFSKWAMNVELPFSRAKIGDKLQLSPIQLDAMLNSVFGRSIGYITQKPNIWDLESGVVREYYLQYGKRVQDYSETDEKNTQQLDAMKSGSSRLDKSEQFEVYYRKELSKQIDKALDTYRDFWNAKDIDGIDKSRVEVLGLIDQYNEGGMPQEIEEYMKNPDPARMKIIIEDKIRNEVANKPFNQYSKDEVKAGKEMAQDFRQQALLARSEYDYDQLLFGVTKLDDKSAKVAEVKETIDNDEEFRKYLASLRYANMISDEAIKTMYTNKVLDRKTANWIIGLDTNRNF